MSTSPGGSQTITQPRKSRRWLRRTFVLIVLAGLFAAWFGSRWEQSEQASFLESNQTAPGRMMQLGAHEIHVVVEGVGEPGVLFISGLGDDFSTWQEVQGRIADSTRAVSYDRPGFGWSTARADDLTLDAAVEDVYQLVSNQELFMEPPVLVGHSLGGAIARRFAYSHPDAISGLVLVDPTPMNSLPTVMRIISGAMMRVNSALSAVGITRRGLYRRNEEAPREQQLLWGALYASSARAREVRREFKGATGSEPILPRKDGLGNMPLVVLVAPSQGPPGFGSVDRDLDVAKRQMVEESSRGRLLEVDTRHYVHYDDPELVIVEVLKTLEAVAEGVDKADVPVP